MLVRVSLTALVTTCTHLTAAVAPVYLTGRNKMQHSDSRAPSNGLRERIPLSFFPLSFCR